MDTAERLEVARVVVKRLGKHRALEAQTPQTPPIENPLGEGYTGVDLDGSTYRARIGVCDALSGIQRRITLGRSKNCDTAAYMYRIAHTALYGSFSWAANSLSAEERDLVGWVRISVLNG